MKAETLEFADIEAERAVLSAILLDDTQADGTLALASNHIRVTIERRDDGVAVDGDFADHRHNFIFAAITIVHGRGDQIDAVSVTTELRRLNRWNSIGGAEYFSEIIDAVMTTRHVETHARIVRREADRRRVDLALAKARRALRASADPDAALVSTLDIIRRDAEGGSVRGGPKPIVDHCEANWKEIEARNSGAPMPKPITLGLDGLDRVTGGGFPGQVVVVAGVQGRGKTAWLAQMLKANGRRFNAEAERITRETGKATKPKRIAWWSLEMPGTELMWRHAGWDAQIPQPVLRGEGRLNQTQMDNLADSFNAMCSLPIDIDGESAPNVLDIRAWLYAHPNTKLAAVDWLGCLQPHPDAPRNAKPHELAAINMEVLSTTARQLGITIVVPNQFTQSANRGTEQTMHDMLGGAAVVNFASVILVMRPGDAMAGDDLPVSIRVEKSRMSSNVIVEAVFRRATGDFVERDRERESGAGIVRLPPAKAGATAQRWRDDEGLDETESA